MFFFTEGEGKYISLYLVIMRGDYDKDLKWPFEGLVNFTLFDQSGTFDTFLSITWS